MSAASYNLAKLIDSMPAKDLFDVSEEIATRLHISVGVGATSAHRGPLLAAVLAHWAYQRLYPSSAAKKEKSKC